jgi:hypothetical protein
LPFLAIFVYLDRLLAVGLVDRNEELFENIARLRRVGRQLPGNDDLAAVRAMLERQLGETVSKRFAARTLGVSHTALDRWIASGDLPVVYTPSGRTEIPVPALLDLREAIEADRASGASRVLAPTMTRRRAAAARLHPEDLRPPMNEDGGHGRASARGLAYHRVIARRLRKSMVAEARHVLFRWRTQGQIAPAYADRWDELLARPLEEIRRAIVADGSTADDLRQNSPFAGMLSEPERRRILSEVR